MSNDNKGSNVNDLRGSGTHDNDRADNSAQKTGQQSQDALRHQQDASHHQNAKKPQYGGSDNKARQQSQGGGHQGEKGSAQQAGSQKDGSPVTPGGSATIANDPREMADGGQKIGSAR